MSEIKDRKPFFRNPGFDKVKYLGPTIWLSGDEALGDFFCSCCCRRRRRRRCCCSVCLFVVVVLLLLFCCCFLGVFLLLFFVVVVLFCFVFSKTYRFGYARKKNNLT